MCLWIFLSCYSKRAWPTEDLGINYIPVFVVVNGFITKLVKYPPPAGINTCSSIQILRSKPAKPSQCSSAWTVSRIWLKLSVVSLGSFMHLASTANCWKKPIFQGIVRKSTHFKSMILQFFIVLYDYINNGRHPHYSDLSKKCNSFFMHEADLELL